MLCNLLCLLSDDAFSNDQNKMGKDLGYQDVKLQAYPPGNWISDVYHSPGKIFDLLVEFRKLSGLNGKVFFPEEYLTSFGGNNYLTLAFTDVENKVVDIYLESPGMEECYGLLDQLEKIYGLPAQYSLMAEMSSDLFGKYIWFNWSDDNIFLMNYTRKANQSYRWRSPEMIIVYDGTKFISQKCSVHFMSGELHREIVIKAQAKE